MSDFMRFKGAVAQRFEAMRTRGLFEVDIERDELWEVYLSSFPSGTNPIYRERTEHDCSCCRHFVRDIGNVVAFSEDGELMTIWDVDLPVNDYYKVVAGKMAAAVRSKPVSNVFFHYDHEVGTDKNREYGDNGEVVVWEHFHLKLPSQCVMLKHLIPSLVGEFTDHKNVFKRTMEELTLEAGEIVLELISQGSLYRGEEHKEAVKRFIREKKYWADEGWWDKDAYAWLRSRQLAGLSRFRNTAIGTLVTDLSNGVEVDEAVRTFESKVAPANYKRPKALVTKSMVDKAKKEIVKLGLENSIQRRHAVIDDVSPNDVLFIDRSVKQGLDVFDEISSDVVSMKQFSKVQEVPIDKFMSDVLPTAEGLEVLFESRLQPNLMTLTAPLHTNAPSLFKWDNGFSWSYNGEVADSIKERVKRAGGKIDAELRFSLAWFNKDDLDIHLRQPDGDVVYYGNKVSRVTGAHLDVDMNIHQDTAVRDAVENLVVPRLGRLIEGEYQVIVNNYTHREHRDFGFEVEMELNGEISTFAYQREVPQSGNVEVCRFTYSKAKGVEVKKSLPSTDTSHDVWGIGTSKFHKVNFMMLSPNHWGEHPTGNKHWFFILDQCRNPDSVRGFYNEFLKEDLTQHRKVLELLGSKMRAEYSDSQLSGFGFSSTQPNHLLCRVTGALNRVVKIVF